jgi:hypothetical protein
MAVGHVTGAKGPAVCGAFRVRPSPRAAPSVTPATPALRAGQPLEEVLSAVDHHGDALATADAHSPGGPIVVAICVARQAPISVGSASTACIPWRYMPLKGRGP